jgi:hypothetical protein
MDIAVRGIDLGKNVCSVVGLGAAREVLVRRRMKRESVVAFTQRWPASVVAMEAFIAALGHVRLPAVLSRLVPWTRRGIARKMP